MKTIKLSKAEQALYDTWRKELMDMMNSVGAFGNEVINFRLRDMALEKGIDLVNEDWQFNAQTYTFSKVEEPTPEIPSGKPDGKKAKKKQGKKSTS